MYVLNGSPLMRPFYTNWGSLSLSDRPGPKMGLQLHSLMISEMEGCSGRVVKSYHYQDGHYLIRDIDARSLPPHTHLWKLHVRKCTAESSLIGYVNVGKIGIVWTKPQCSSGLHQGYLKQLITILPTVRQNMKHPK